MLAGPSYTYANHRYMQKEFGVTTTQSIASGYPVYDAHSGSDAVGLGFSSNGVHHTPLAHQLRYGHQSSSR